MQQLKHNTTHRQQPAGKKILQQATAINDNRPQTAILRRQVSNMQLPAQLKKATGALPGQAPKTGLPLHYNNPELPIQAFSMVDSQSQVMQLFPWGKALALVPGTLVIAEGGLSIGAAFLQGAKNPTGAIASGIVGGTKLVRGLVMILNAFDFGQDPEAAKQRKKYVKVGVDLLRTIEAGASTYSALEAYMNTPEAQRMAVGIVTSMFAALAKALRSVLHFLEGYINSYVYSIFLQGIEAAEGIAIAVNGWFNPEQALGHVLESTGASKVIRGGVSGGLQYHNRPKGGERQPLLPDTQGTPVTLNHDLEAGQNSSSGGSDTDILTEVK